MNIKRLLLLLMVMGFAVGCSSTPEQDEGETAPEPEAPLAEEATVEDSDGSTNYMVENGDNLWTISGQGNVYGNPYQWPLIYKANRDQIKDADLIYAGQDLAITRGMSDDAINAAVNHAKTRGAWSLGESESSDEAYLNE